MKTKSLPPKLQAWVIARKKHHLSHAHVQMARELGMNPKKLGKIDNHKQETWKAPLPEFIERIYQKTFSRPAPNKIRTIEQQFELMQKKKALQKKHCPCNSQKLFSDCCELYLLRKLNAPTPECLMRSRYTAYTLANIDYIQKTMCKKAAENYDPIAAAKWASSVTWLGLTVVEAPPPKNNIGTVTFFAQFFENNDRREIVEKSLFEKIDGTWFYVGTWSGDNQ